MIFELNVRYSVRCSSCGKKLDCAADTNSAENYDVVLVVEPHDCSRTTPRALDKCPSCAGKGSYQIGVYSETCATCHGSGTCQ